MLGVSKRGVTKCPIILGHEINIPAQVAVGTQDQVEGCTRDRVVAHIPGPVAVGTRVLVAVGTRVLEAGYIPDREAAFTLGQEVASIAAPVEACTQGHPVTLIEAIYHLGLCSLTILRNAECSI